MGLKGLYLYDGNYDYILKYLQMFDISSSDISSSDISYSDISYSDISSDDSIWLDKYFSGENIQTFVDSINYNIETTPQVNFNSDISSIIDIVKDISFNKNFYNDPSFNINGEINPIYLNYPYNLVTRNTICIEKEVYYRISNIKTVEDISINTDISCNMCSMYSLDNLCCRSSCPTCKGSGIKIICEKCNEKGWYYDCPYCDKNHIITDPSMYHMMYQNLLIVSNEVDTSSNEVDTSSNEVDTSMVFYCSCPKIDCSVCNSSGLLYSDIKYTDISGSYNIISNLEIEVSVYKKRDIADIFTNRNKIDTLFFKKPTNKGDDQKKLWEKSYIYIKPLIEEKLHNQIKSNEFFKYLNLHSNIEDR